jgi:hypothetical protein
MPWCEDCAKFWNPSSMRPDGSCPTCGRVLPLRDAGRAEPDARRAAGEHDHTDDADAGAGLEPAAELEKVDFKKLAGKDAKAPWHFKVLMALLAIYLTWRLVQLVQLVV